MQFDHPPGEPGASPHRDDVPGHPGAADPPQELRRLLDVVQRVLRRFATLDDDSIDDGIDEAMAAIGSHARVDRSYVFRIDRARDRVQNTHEWCAPGIRPEIDNLQELPFATIGDWRQPLEAGESIHIPRVTALPDSRRDQRDLFTSQGIQSLLVVPLTGPQELYGFIGFDAVRSRRHWSADAQLVLRTVADVIVGALLRRQATAELAARERRYSALARYATDLVMVIDDSGRIDYLSPSAERLLGWDPADVHGSELAPLLHVDDRGSLRAALSAAASADGQRLPDFRLQRYDGGWCWFLGTATDLRHDPAVAGVVINAHNIDRRKRAEEALRREATHDALTGLPNRLLLGELLSRAIARVARGRSALGVVFIDLDHFKLVNDAMGHQAGDEVLQQAAQRLQLAMRGADIVARFGGDEFVAILESEADMPESLVTATERLLGTFQAPFRAGGVKQRLSASAGLVITQGEHSAEELLRDADAAMYRAKETGRGALQCFDRPMRDRVLDRLSLLRDLREAIDDRQLTLHYQPIFDSRSGAIRGTEALLRWAHPERGWVSPAEFVPLAEQSGLIGSIGQWVLEAALVQLQQWRDGAAPPADFFVAVNLSAHQLAEPDLAQRVDAALERWRLPPASLCLEVTESALMQNPQVSIDVLLRLQRQGVALAIDDFGTGYSSLAYLRDLPASRLKIDRSFVSVVLDDSRGRGIVEAICTLARQFGVLSVAEGIETEAQADALRELGCDLMQGFHLARPQPPEGIAALLHGRR